MITDVWSPSPAEASGLIPGDILVGVGGEEGLTPLVAGLQRMRAGAPLRLRVLRGGQPIELEATPGEFDARNARM